MIYQKPKDVTYTQMAMFIDKHAYDENSTNELNNLIFEYIYHLVEMLAYKAKFFNRYSYYDDFAIYVASSVYLRLKNPKQFEYDNNGNPKLKRVKSILNYIKTILYDVGQSKSNIFILSPLQYNEIAKEKFVIRII